MKRQRPWVGVTGVKPAIGVYRIDRDHIASLHPDPATRQNAKRNLGCGFRRGRYGRWRRKLRLRQRRVDKQRKANDSEWHWVHGFFSDQVSTLEQAVIASSQSSEGVRGFVHKWRAM